MTTAQHLKGRAIVAMVTACQRDRAEISRLEVSMRHTARSNWGEKPERVRLLRKRLETLIKA